MNRLRNFILGLLIIGLFLNTAMADVAKFDKIDPSNEKDISSIQGETQDFSVETNQTVDFTWYIDDKQDGNTDFNQTTSSYSKSTASVGNYTVTVKAENINGIIYNNWTWSVVPISVVISEPAPSTPSTLVDETITFSIKINQNCEVKWYIDEEHKHTNSSQITFASFTTSESSSGTYIIEAIATNTTTDPRFSWRIIPLITRTPVPAGGS